MRSTLLGSLLFALLGCDGASQSSREAAVRATIPAIQGSGVESPYEGRAVIATGIVAGDFQDADGDETANLGGFYLQAESGDDDVATSDGVFVFDRNLQGPDVSVGDRVRVSGAVVEQFAETQIEATAVEVVGSGRLRVGALSLPAAAAVKNGDGDLIPDLERFEGMLINVAPTMYVQELRTLERHGDITLSVAQRERIFTSVERPDPAGFDSWQEEVATRSLVLDDGLIQRYAQPIRYLFPDERRPGWSPRVGDAVDGLQGVLRYSRGSGADGRETWRLMPVAAPRFRSLNTRPPPSRFDADVTVASFNVLNYFATIDRGNPVCGPQAASGCRGADSAAELERQRAKIVSALQQLDADIVGLMEIENGPAIRELTDALNREPGSAPWSFVDTGVIGDDAIRVALIYRSDKVTASGPYAVLDSRVDARFDSDRNRPALAQSFRRAGNGGLFTVVVNHLKSKGSPCDGDGDPDLDDGQGNCNATRRNAAVALAKWLAGDPTGSEDRDYLVIGDLNAYRYEDPVRALEEAGLVNLLARDVGDDAYTFVFDGRSGALDHALASPALAMQIAGVAVWHINADEPPVFDYNLESGRDPALFDADAPWRASDHDPLLIGLKLLND